MPSIAEERIAILETAYRYAQGLDTKDWSLYRSIFTDEIGVDFSDYNGQPGEHISADEWVARLQPLFAGLDATQHSMTNPMVTFDDSGATCRMYMQAEHFLDANDGETGYAIGGYYTFRFIQKAARWYIERVKLTLFWRRGNPDIMVKAAEKGMATATENKWARWSKPVSD